MIKTSNQLESLLRAGTDLYNEETGTYAFLYNEKGSIAHYTLTNKQAIDVAKEAREIGEEYWGTLLGPGGYIVEPDDIPEWCENQPKEGWVIADVNYGRTVKLHARVTKEIEVSYEQAERLVNFLSGATENANIDDIQSMFIKDTESGDYEYGYIPYPWVKEDLKSFMDEIHVDKSELIYKNDIEL